MRVIALDFSKAFDTVRHANIADKLSNLPIADNVYNWFVNYFSGHEHATLFRGQRSEYCSINAGVFRGDRKSTRLNSSHRSLSRMPSSA